MENIESCKIWLKANVHRSKCGREVLAVLKGLFGLAAVASCVTLRKLTWEILCRILCLIIKQTNQPAFFIVDRLDKLKRKKFIVMAKVYERIHFKAGSCLENVHVIRKLFFFLLLISASQTHATETLTEPSLTKRPLDYTRTKLERVLRLRQKGHEWEKIVRGFRKEHHFSLLFGSTSGEWLFQEYGTAINESHRSLGLEISFRYAFHIPIHKGFGYFLGTSLGTQNERQIKSKVKAPTIMKFPGIVSGLVWNFSPVTRARFGSELYLERWDDLGLESDDDSANESVSVTTRVSSFFVALDIFLELYYGVAFEFASRKNIYIKPTQSAKQMVDADLGKKEQVVRFAFTYHLL